MSKENTLEQFTKLSVNTDNNEQFSCSDCGFITNIERHISYHKCSKGLPLKKGTWTQEGTQEEYDMFNYFWLKYGNHGMDNDNDNGDGNDDNDDGDGNGDDNDDDNDDDGNDDGNDDDNKIG